MITKLLNEVNEKIETLNNLVQNKEYFKKLEERIEKVNNHIQEQKQEIERLNKGINEIIQYINSLELGSDQQTYNKEGYQVDVYDIEKMLVELIGVCK